jgi:hypothetical protein
VAAAFLETVFFADASAAGVAGAGAGAGVAATTGASSVFLVATRLPLVEAEAEFIILVPVEVFISIKRTGRKIGVWRSQFFSHGVQFLKPGSHGPTFFFEIDPAHVPTELSFFQVQLYYFLIILF